MVRRLVFVSGRRPFIFILTSHILSDAPLVPVYIFLFVCATGHQVTVAPEQVGSLIYLLVFSQIVRFCKNKKNKNKKIPLLTLLFWWKLGFSAWSLTNLSKSLSFFMFVIQKFYVKVCLLYSSCTCIQFACIVLCYITFLWIFSLFASMFPIPIRFFPFGISFHYSKLRIIYIQELNYL